MIHITIDPSMLTGFRANGDCKLAVNIGGCAWDKSGGDEPLFTSEADLMDKLYPWHWETPVAIAVIWLSKFEEANETKYRKVGESVLNAINFEHAQYAHDVAKIRGHYQSALNDKIIVDSSQNPVLIRDNEILKAANQDLIVELEIGEEIVNTSGVTNYLTSSIAQFAQKLTPANAANKLTFFADGNLSLNLPEGDVTHYIAYPIGGEEDRNWSKYTHIWRNDAEYLVPPTNDGEPIPPLEIQPNKFYITYTNEAGDTTLLKLFCPITEIPQVTEEVERTRLRNEYGDFLGHTGLEVYDSDILFHKDEFKEALIKKTGPLFNLPGLLYEFLEGNKTSLSVIDNAVLGGLCNKINDLFTILLRDAVSIGNGRSVAVSAAVLNGNDPANPNGLIDVYNASIKNEAEYIKLEIGDVIRAVENFDRGISGADWRSVLRSIISLDLILSEIEKYVVTNNVASIEKWLSLWRSIINNPPPTPGADAQPSSIFHKGDLLEAQILHVVKNALINGPETDERSRRSRELFTQVAADYFEHYNPGNLFLESIAINLKGNGKDTQFQSDSVIAIRSTLTDLSKYYVEHRRANNEFLPSIEALVNDIEFIPFPNNTTTFWPAFIDFVKAADFEAGVISLDLDNEIGAVLRKPTDIPPKVLINVDEVDSNDDLSKEISGYLLYVQRAEDMHKSDQTAFEEVDWKGLNWARVDLQNTKDPANIDVQSLDNDYLIPSLLPTSGDIKNVFLTLSNEQLSLVAGHDLYHDPRLQDDKENSDHQFQYLFENSSGKLPPGYALWYGYHYKFAGFVALNSGVLPETLREAPEKWNIPAHEIEQLETELVTRYKHLRRVPFSKVSCRLSTTDKKDLTGIPSGLLTIASELNQLKNMPVSLLYNNGKGNKQEKIKIELGKPMTNFWNWYAWRGNELTGAQLDKVLTEEFSVRGNPDKRNDYLHDPALENTLLISVEQVFPPSTDKHELSIKLAEHDTGGGLTTIENGSISVEVSNVANVTVTGSKIQVPAGVVVKISVRCATPKANFIEGTNRFHSWMDTTLDSTSIKPVNGKDCYLTRPVEMVFEAALKPTGLISPSESWHALSAFETGQKQVALDLTKNNVKFGYYSRTVVDHQVWHWNGRLSASLLGQASEAERSGFPHVIDPEEGGETNYAMKWEAWEFSDRPDFSSMRHSDNLRVRASENEKQTIFTDLRDVDDKALYYRLTAELFGRYELLGGDYAGSVKSAIGVKSDDKLTPNRWKRYFKPSRKITALPKPVIRFVIPLTESVDECHSANEIRSASLMIVLNDRWFSESGLAEKCEIGIEVLNYDSLNYLNSGLDPTLSGKALKNLDIDMPFERGFYIERPEDDPNTIEKENPIAVFTPEGPAGLTHDLATPTPKLIASTFILKVNDINRFLGGDALTAEQRGPQMNAWSMAQIAVRRTVEEKFWENPTKEDEPKILAGIKSKWTAKEWVQFVPDTSSLLPIDWRKELTMYGTVEFDKSIVDANEAKLTYKNKWTTPDDDTWSGFPVMSNNDNEDFNLRTERYLVVSEETRNAGGQPVEKYLATFKFDGANGFEKDDLLDPERLKIVENGYGRLITVRVQPHDKSTKSLWEKLFGANRSKKVGFDEVQNDPEAALPLISKRFAIKM